jgi:hypothetical protein
VLFTHARSAGENGYAVALSADCSVLAARFRPAGRFAARLLEAPADLFAPRAACSFAALTAAQRFFVAAIIACLPAALSRRFRFCGAGAAAGEDSPFEAAHLFLCASAMRARASADNFLRPRRPPVCGAALGCGEPPCSLFRKSAICSSIRRFCASKPSMAALMISELSV